MFKLLKEYKFYFAIAIFIFLPILSINLRPSEKNDFGFFEKTILFITAPVQEVLTFGVQKTGSFFQNYVFLIHLKKNYYDLIEENRKLQNIIHNFKEVEAENKRLRSLLEFQNKIEDKKTTAQVIARDVSIEFRSIRINKGKLAGIQKGMAVVTHEGVIGKVLRVSDHFADIITILDDLSAVDAVIQRTRARGVVEGSTDSQCILKYALRTDEIEVGDTVLTSGLDGIYPKGLLIGTVTSVKKKSFGITQDVKVKPSVDFSKLEEVMIILTEDKQLSSL